MWTSTIKHYASSVPEITSTKKRYNTRLKPLFLLQRAGGEDKTLKIYGTINT